MEKRGGSQVLIRCDGGATLGLGHVKRCLALAEKLSFRHGLRCHFLGRYDTGAGEQIEARGFGVSSLEEDEGKAIARHVHKSGARVVLFDIRTDLRADALRGLRQEGVRIVTLDDGSPRRLAADIAVLPPTAAALGLDWSGFAGEALIGWTWTVLAAAPSPAHAPEGGPLRLLVSMGGADPQNLTRRCARLLLPLKRAVHPLFVIGAACASADVVAVEAAKLWPEGKVLLRPASLEPAIAEADLALVAYGVTAQELAAAGVPALYLALSEDHQGSARALAQTGAGLALGLAEGLDDREIELAVARLAADGAARHRMSLAGRKAIDGEGAARLAQRIAALLAEASDSPSPNRRRARR